MELVFATNNNHKLQEAHGILPDGIRIRSLADVNFYEDIPETSDTLEGNAELKARAIYDRLHTNTFADDTGLEVPALNMQPGVRSARYAGDHKNNTDNIHLLLKNLAPSNDHSARFRTVIALILEGKVYSFEGIVNGKIIEELRGSGGFGYDPVFIPDGFDKTFAEMTEDEKNNISHRGRALRKMADFLTQIGS